MLSKRSWTQTERIVWFYLQNVHAQAKRSAGWEVKTAVILGGTAPGVSWEAGHVSFLPWGVVIPCVHFVSTPWDAQFLAYFSLCILYFIKSSYWKEQGWGEFSPGSGGSSNDWFSGVAEVGVPTWHQRPVLGWQCLSRMILWHDFGHGSGFPACLALTSPLRALFSCLLGDPVSSWQASQ